MARHQKFQALPIKIQNNRQTSSSMARLAEPTVPLVVLAQRTSPSYSPG
jgi:hypothetical protein